MIQTTKTASWRSPSSPERDWWAGILFAWIGLLGLVGLLAQGGCARAPQPLDPRAVNEPALWSIVDAFEKTVRESHADPLERWHAGWLGNAAVHWRRPARNASTHPAEPTPQRPVHLGLCYEWQWRVHEGVWDAAHAVGWEATLVSVDYGRSTEHHAVLVYDPNRVEPELPEIAADRAPAFVLDAWRRGRADVFAFHEWIRRHRKDDPVFVVGQLPSAWPAEDGANDVGANQDGSSAR